MPQLQDLKNRPSKKIVLPSSKDGDEAWVEIYTEPLTDDIVFLSRYQDDKEMATVASIFRVLKDWNFTESDGKKAEVSIENVRRLSINDLASIIEGSQLDKKFQALSRLNTPKKKS